jgi:hypothetical protein
MKHLLIIFAIAIIGMAATCDTNELYSLRIRADVDFDQVYPGIFRQIGLVSDFQHVYDSIDVTATRVADGRQYFFKNAKTPALEIPVGAGTYNIFIATKGDPKALESYLFFTAVKNDIVSAKLPTEVVIPAETKQALILVQKSSVDGAPTIQVDATSGIMSISANYYYAYVKGTTAVITYKQNAIQSQMQVTIKAANIYVLSAAKAKINIAEPFTNLQQI